ncbi:hypothetical protein [Myxosarcina sp. GI1(2024)]
MQVEVVTLNGSPTIEINGQYLLTVTELDAKLRDINTFSWAEQLSQILQQALMRAKRERQPEFLSHRAAIAGGIMLVVVIGNWMLLKLRWRIQPTKAKVDKSEITAKTSESYSRGEKLRNGLAPQRAACSDRWSTVTATEAIATNKQYRNNFQAIENRLWRSDLIANLFD